MARPDRTPPVRLLGDIACPWTYLTLTALVRAFGESLRLEWHPFLLPAGDFRGQRERLSSAVASYAKRLEAPFVAEALDAPVDGRLAHGVVLAAVAEDRGREAAEALFAAHFAHGKPLVESDAVASALAERVGASTVARWLEQANGSGAVVERASRAARLAGVSEIPLTVIDNGYVIGGLQPPEAYRALVELAVVEAQLEP